jgi:lipoate-protein ligase A
LRTSPSIYAIGRAILIAKLDLLRETAANEGTGMRYLDLTLSHAADNLALDEALLLLAESGANGEVLRVWEVTRPVVVLGAGCKWADEVHDANCAADGVPILRRSSGGGTVLWGRGCLLYSVVLNYDRSPQLHEIGSSYAYILEQVSNAVRDVVPDIRPAGTSDLAVGERKCSGNAQQRKRRHLLHHGTLLYDFDLAQVGRYLLPPPRQPEYRAGREHTAFLCNLPLSGDELKRRLRDVWQATPAGEEYPAELVRQLVAEKYSRVEWNRRR